MRLVKPTDQDSIWRRPFVQGLLVSLVAIAVSLALHWLLTLVGG